MPIADLFRPKWRNSNEAVRKKAVGELSDDLKLTRIIKDAQETFEIRAIAFQRLSAAYVRHDVLRTLCEQESDFAVSLVKPEALKQSDAQDLVERLSWYCGFSRKLRPVYDALLDRLSEAELFDLFDKAGLPEVHSAILDHLPSAQALLKRYTDGEESRNWTILKSHDHKTAHLSFPDFDVAYFRAAGTIESEGQPGTWGQDVLRAGLTQSHRKSLLLFALAADSAFRGKGHAAFVYSVQAVHAAPAIPRDSGAHVYACFALYYFFQHDPAKGDPSIPALVGMNSPPIEIPSYWADMISQAMAKARQSADARLVEAAETVLRSKLQVRPGRHSFPSVY